jgi:putative transposase
VTAATVTQAYRFALDPTPAQERDLAAHAGAARFAYNWALAAVKANLAQREAERSYGITDDDLTSSLSWNLPALRRAWNQAKGIVAPWWAECSKEAFNTGLDGLARALKNFSAAKNGQRGGKRVGFPRFKSRRRTVPSIRFTTGAIRVEADRKHVTLPRLGTIKTHESTRKLARRLEAGTARILSATVRREGGRWHVAFTVEITRAQRGPVRPEAVVAVDVGISSLAVLSTGDVVPNPRHLTGALGKLRRLGRQAARQTGPFDPATRTRRPASKNWADTQAKIARAHARVANLRKDGLHKLTTALATTYGTIVVEDLNVTGMLTNGRLARHLADASFGEIRRQLDYKTTWNSGVLLVADRWFPSSKTCSGCGTVKAKLRLSERTYTCEHCGLTLDRDLNAARNLAALATPGTATSTGSGPEEANSARRADQKTGLVPAGGDEAGTPRPQGIRRGPPAGNGTATRSRAHIHSQIG